MKEFLGNITSSISITDVLDILIVSFVIYKVLDFIRETRAQQLVKGLLVLVITFFVSDLFHLYTLNWILKGTMTLGVIALVVVFQPELRRGLEYVGRSKLMRSPLSLLNKDEIDAIVGSIVHSSETFSKERTGALIVFERETQLIDISETGTFLDCEISSQILGNIFYEGAPLHDGAVIIRGDRVLAAGCVLPLTEDKSLNRNLGTRHRAGIGISEQSDAVVLIVSEETGVVSVAENGVLKRFVSADDLKHILISRVYKSNDNGNSFVKLFERLGRRDKNVK